MIVSWFVPHLYFTNCLINVYIKCLDLITVGKVFDEMPKRDTVSWKLPIYEDQCDTRN